MRERQDESHQYILTQEMQCGSFAKEHLPDHDQVAKPN
jgi:hypothetical protein